MLVQLKQYMSQHRITSLLQLSKEFNAAPEVLRDMLTIWIRKGKVGMQAKPPGCAQRCQQCDPLALEVYHWLA